MNCENCLLAFTPWRIRELAFERFASRTSYKDNEVYGTIRSQGRWSEYLCHVSSWVPLHLVIAQEHCIAFLNAGSRQRLDHAQPFELVLQML